MRQGWIVMALQCLLWTPGMAQTSDLEQLQAAYVALGQARNSRDAGGLAAAVDDRTLFFDSQGLLTDDIGKKGKAAFREGLRKVFSEVIRDIDERAINPQYRVIGGTGIVWADFDATVDFTSGKTETIKGRSIHIFTKLDGKWLVAAAFRYPRE